MAEELQVVYVPIKELTHDPQNARKHDEKNLQSIIASLVEFGQRKPIVALPDGTVVAGNGTLEAATRLGWETIAVAYTPWDDEQKARAYAIADNRSGELASWDETILAATLQSLDTDVLLATGFDTDDLAELSLRTGPMEVEGTSRGTGLGTPIIAHTIIFDDEDQQKVWFDFLKYLRERYPDADTAAQRLTNYCAEILVEQGS